MDGLLGHLEQHCDALPGPPGLARPLNVQWFQLVGESAKRGDGPKPDLRIRVRYLVFEARHQVNIVDKTETVNLVDERFR